MVREAVRTHLFDHNERALSREGYQFRWNCPRCGAARAKHEKEDAVWSFEQHLFDHVEQQLETDTHVTDEIGSAGNALVLSSPERANDARIHFFDSCDVAILVTTAVADRLRLLAERGSSWPDRTIVLTTEERPLASVDDLDLRDVPLEVVELDRTLGLDEVGETISRVIAEHNSPNADVSLAFDMLSEVLATNDLEPAFTFFHLLTERVETADAFAHFYCDPDTTAAPTMNLLSELFDARLSVTEDRFVLES
ncbi:DUF7504 family protein [Natronobacterium texcoconense]|uniref:DUF7504 family protein n=1 Tax=Natronobacterium texcoconense TaxID=1095778 RepID=UPI001FCDB88C|nr:hypothetical protein [Natronobacterium texcoconense]